MLVYLIWGDADALSVLNSTSRIPMPRLNISVPLYAVMTVQTQIEICFKHTQHNPIAYYGQHFYSHNNVSHLE